MRTVEELIKELQQLPPKAIICAYGYQDGWSEDVFVLRFDVDNKDRYIITPKDDA